jgi:hypothetical protein
MNLFKHAPSHSPAQLATIARISKLRASAALRTGAEQQAFLDKADALQASL